MASAQLQKLLEAISVAGIFISMIVTAVFLIFALVGAVAGSEPSAIWSIVWNAFFIGLPLYGLLFAALKVREFLRDILRELKKQAA